ncbi:MAG: hypothetical protein LLG00_09330 [Planctomycetaceae bacterium]|nr:hypothetical protein [Planctomycetaceae bacterium]
MSFRPARRHAAALRVLAFMLVASAIGAVAAAESQVGLHQQDGRLLLHGKPFRGIGVNFVDAFMRPLADPDDPSTEEAFRILAEHRIPFLRTVASGWGGAGMKLYQSDRVEYFRRMDKTVGLAEKYRVGLICSLFWPGWVRDLSGESQLDAWTDPASKTRQLMETYVKEMVTRYRSSRAIWGWEWGNELVLMCHLPNAASFGIKPDDHYTYEVMRKVYRDFAREVRRYDSYRVIDSGDTAPRESAWHNSKDGSWAADTPEQFAEILADNSPDPLDLLSIHSYKNDFNPNRLPVANSVAHKLRKPLFVGEFGVSGPHTKASEKEFRRQLAILDRENVQLAALWEFDVRPIARPEWLVSPSNDKFYMLLAIEALNRTWMAAGR